MTDLSSAVIRDDLALALLRERVRLHRDAVATSAAAGLLVAGVLLYLLRGAVSPARLGLWFGLLVAVHALRWGCSRRVSTAPGVAVRRLTLYWFRAGVLANGAAWAVFAVLVLPAAGGVLFERLLYALMTLCAGTLVVISFDLAAAFAFVVPVLLALAVQLGARPPEDARGLVFIGALLAAMLAVGVVRARGTMLQALKAGAAASARAEEADAARRELAEKHRLMTLLLQTTRQGFWSVDADGVTIDLNPAMCALLGRTRNEVLGHTVFDFFDGESLATLQREIAARRGGAAGSYEIEIHRPDGSVVHCLNHATPIHDAQGRHTGSIGLWTDITAPRRAEEALRRHERVTNSISEMVSVISEDRHYRLVNDAWCSYMGLERAQVIGRHVSEVFLGTVTEERRVAFNDCLRLGEPRTVRGAAGVPQQSGRIIETTYYPFTDVPGERCVVAVTRDVTASQRAAEALVAARDEAERANRAKSQFLAQMSHELRTPMNAILGFGQLLATDARHPLAAVQRGWIDAMLRGARHLLELINEVLDLQRVESGQLAIEPADVDLAELGDECLNLVRALTTAHAVQLPARAAAWDELHVRADRRRLKQVLLNLLGNAIKYNRRPGSVALEAAADGERVRLAVRDSGPGIAPEGLARLFQPFERLDAAKSGIEGTGIGLALCRRLVQAMEGEIGAESEPGVGSVFWVRLPRAAAAADRRLEPQQPASALPASAAERKTVVLYIEDNPVNVYLMEAMFERLEGLRLVGALTAREGLAFARSQPPALVLLDVQLGETNGSDVLAALRADAATREVPVVIVSANAMDDEMKSMLAAGADAYVTKPIELEALAAVVGRFVKTRLGGQGEAEALPAEGGSGAS